MSTNDTWQNFSKVGDQFSTTSQLASYIINPEWKEGFNSLSNSAIVSEYSFLWNTISASCENIGNEIYKKISNYINNISNIDTCEVHSLYSFAKLYGYDNTLLYMDFSFPNEIYELVNIFSINKVYLTESNNVLNTTSINKLKALSGSDFDYLQYIKEVFYNTLSAFVNLTYADNNKLIWNENIVKYTTQLFNSNEHSDEDILLKKIELNVPTLFTERRYVDEIENNVLKMSDFSYTEQQILLLEVKRREKATNITNNISKYAYARENKVLNYFRFVTLMSSEGYVIEPYEINITKNEILSENIDTLIKYNTSTHTYYIDDSLLETTSKKLVDLCLRISYMREHIKNQALKYNLTGTEMIVVAFIKELLHTSIYSNQLSGFWRYLLPNVTSTLNISANTDLNVDIIEYNDPAEYYNIAATNYEVSGIGYEVFGNNILFNDRFWENEQLYVDDISKNEMLEFYNRMGLGRLFTTSYDTTSGGILSSFEYGEPELYCLQRFLATLFHAAATSANSLYRDIVTTEYPDGYYPPHLIEDWREIITGPIGTRTGYILANIKHGLFYSYDKINWTKYENIPNSSNKFSDVVYGRFDNIYYATDYEKGIYQSSDGINWRPYNNTVNIPGFIKLEVNDIIPPPGSETKNKNSNWYLALNESGDMYAYPHNRVKAWARTDWVCGAYGKGLRSVTDITHGNRSVWEYGEAGFFPYFYISTQNNGIYRTKSQTVWPKNDMYGIVGLRSNRPSGSALEIDPRPRTRYWWVGDVTKYQACGGNPQAWPIEWELTYQHPGFTSLAFGSDVNNVSMLVAINTHPDKIPSPAPGAGAAWTLPGGNIANPASVRPPTIIQENERVYSHGVYSLDDTDVIKSRLYKAYEYLQPIASDYQYVKVFHAYPYFYLKNAINEVYWTSRDEIIAEIDPRLNTSETHYVFTEDVTNIRKIDSIYYATTTNAGVLSSYNPKTGFNLAYPAVIEGGSITESSIKTSPVGSDEVDIFNKYSGIPTSGYTPYAYIKNTTHASYQLHPFVIGFKQYMRAIRGIKNLFLHTLPTKEIIFSNISNRIDSYGNSVNLWIEDNNDFTGYSSFYEYSDKRIDDNLTITTYDYRLNQDSPFNFDALNDYINNKSRFVNGVNALSGEYYNYYSHLNLSTAQKNKIVDQLNRFYPNIFLLSEYKIYKYGKDKYENVYILYKKSYDDINEKGQLWIRLKNHPIAFPAFIYNSEEISLSDVGQITDTDITDIIDQLTILDVYNSDGTLSGTINIGFPKKDFTAQFTNVTIHISGGSYETITSLTTPINIIYNTIEDEYYTTNVLTNAELSGYFYNELTLRVDTIDDKISIFGAFPTVKYSSPSAVNNVYFTGGYIILSNDAADLKVSFKDDIFEDNAYLITSTSSSLPAISFNHMDFDTVTLSVSGTERYVDTYDYTFTNSVCFQHAQTPVSSYIKSPIVQHGDEDREIVIGGYNTKLYYGAADALTTYSASPCAIWTSLLHVKVEGWTTGYPSRYVNVDRIYAVNNTNTLYYSPISADSLTTYDIIYDDNYYLLAATSGNDITKRVFLIGDGPNILYDIISSNTVAFQKYSMFSEHAHYNRWIVLKFLDIVVYGNTFLVVGRHKTLTSNAYYPMWTYSSHINNLAAITSFPKNINLYFIICENEKIITGGQNCGIYTLNASDIDNKYNEMFFTRSNAPSSNNIYTCAGYNSKNGTIVVGGYNTGLYYALSSDYNTWNLGTTPAPSSTIWTDITYSSFDDTFVAVSTTSGIYCSTDAGYTWIKSKSASSINSPWLGVYSDEINDKIVTMSTSGIYLGAGGDTYETRAVSLSHDITSLSTPILLEYNTATDTYETTNIITHPAFNINEKRYLYNELSGTILSAMHTLSGSLYSTVFTTALTGTYNTTFLSNSNIYLRDSYNRHAINLKFDNASLVNASYLSGASQKQYYIDGSYESGYDTYALSGAYEYIQDATAYKYYYNLDMFYNIGFNYSRDLLYLDYQPLTASDGYEYSNTMFGLINGSSVDSENTRTFRYLKDPVFIDSKLNDDLIEDYRHIDTIINESDIYYLYRKEYEVSGLYYNAPQAMYRAELRIFKYNKNTGIEHKTYYVPVKYDVDSLSATWKAAVSNSLLTVAFTSKSLDDSDIIINSNSVSATYIDVKDDVYENGITTIQFNISNGFPIIYDTVKYFYKMERI